MHQFVLGRGIMEAIIFTGIQATGKSTFYKQYFADTHVRINLDMLKTRRRETLLLEACIEAKQSFVIDNTNPTAENRKKYIEPARAAGFQIIGYYFQSKIKQALLRNRQRSGKACIPEAGVRSAFAKLQRPDFSEGFDVLYYVTIIDLENEKAEKEGKFQVNQWIKMSG
jgi:predicted kinase